MTRGRIFVFKFATIFYCNFYTKVAVEDYILFHNQILTSQMLGQYVLVV